MVEVDGADFSLPGVRLTLKLELLQHTKLFKTRGAFANMLGREIPAAGVVAASGGNHGVAVAYAAGKLGKPVRIFVPTVDSVEMECIRGYGAGLVVTGERYADALAASETWAAESGAMPVHAYDQPETMLGQGSVGLEFAEQAPGMDSLLVAVGGGGLIGGIAAWYAGRVALVGVEPEAAPTLARALEAGHPVDSPAGGIAADSLAPRSRRVRHRVARAAASTRAAWCWCPTAPYKRRSAFSARAPRSHRTRRRRRHGRTPLRPLPAPPWRTRRRTGVRSEYHRCSSVASW